MMITRSKITTTDTSVLQANNDLVVLGMYFCNVSGATITLSIYLLNSDIEPCSLDNVVIKDISIESGDTYFWSADTKLSLSAGDAIKAISSDVDSVNAFATYVEM